MKFIEEILNKEGMKMIVRTFFLIALVTLACAQAGSVKARP